MIEDSNRMGPLVIDLIPGKEYKWCTCALSEDINQAVEDSVKGKTIKSVLLIGKYNGQ